MENNKALQRERIYHGEKCRGQVVANFFVSGRTVEAYFVDGDMGCSEVVYSVEQRGKFFFLSEREKQSPEPYAPIAPKNKRLNAKTRKEAIKEMIDYIVKPYIKPGEWDFPVNADELRKGLETALLKKEEESKEKQKK